MLKTIERKIGKKIQEALEASELRYRRLFEAAQDGILILDAKTGMIEDVNPYLIHMLGYSREEFVEKKLWDVGAFRDVKASKEAFEILQDKEYIRYENLPLKTKDGRLIQVEFVSNVYLAGHEKVIQCNIRDITEHKRIVLALQANERKYYDLLALSPDGIFIIDLVGGILTVNNAMCRELGYSEEEFLAMKIWDIIPQQYLDEYKSRLTRILAGEVFEEAPEYEVRGKDGRDHYVEILSTPHYDEKDIVGFQGIARDITARKQAEQALRKSEENYRTLFENMLNGLAHCRMIYDDQGRPVDFVYLDVNRAFGQLTGLENVVGKRITEVMPGGKESNPELFELYGRVASSGNAESLEVELKPLVMSLFISVYAAEPGNFVAVFEDITERKRAVEALRANEEKYRMLVKHLPTVVYTNPLDDASSTLYVSPQIERLLGYTVQEWLADPKLWSKVIHPEDYPEVLKQTSLAHQRKRAFDMDYRMIARDGELVWVHDHLNLVNDSEGNPQYWQGIMLDITDRKQAEAATREGQQRFSQVWEATSDAMALSDPDGIVLAANQAYLALYGYKREEIVGRSFAVIFPEEIQAQAVEQYKIVFASEVIPPTFESVIRRADGSERIVESTVAFLTRTDQRIAMLSTIRDITERKQAEEQVRSSRGFLQSVQNALSAHIAILDQEGNIVQVNSAWRDFGAKNGLKHPDHCIGRNYLEICDSASGESAEEAPLIAQAIREVLSGGQDEVSVEYPCHAPHKKRWFVARVTSFVNDQRRWIVVAHENITERKLAEEKTQRQVEHLIALGSIDRMISSNYDLKLTLSEILTHVTAELKVDAADILILDTSSQTLEFGAGRGFRTNVINNTQVRMGEGYAGRVALERKLVQVRVQDEDAGTLLLNTILQDEGFSCYFGVPLITKGQLRGVLEIYHRSMLEPDGEWFEFLNTLAGQAAIAAENAMLFDSLQRSNLELSLAYDATIEGWSRALDLRDKETEGHSLRVTQMTVNLARALGLREEELVQVRWGSLLHDIGKMGVPDAILLKPGELTEAEWVAMKKHPIFAYEMLSPIRYLRLALDIPYCHHEKWDGSGYPRGLKGDQIPLSARIFAVVDVWDALNSNRPYRAAWTKEKAIDYIHTSTGTHFDPHVVDFFMRVIAK